MERSLYDPGGDALRASVAHVARLDEVLAPTADLDGVARACLTHLALLPGVRRAGVAFTEGAGRRLQFLASDWVGPGLQPGLLPWCHIDAYDDVPLNTVARTGRPEIGSLEELEKRFAGVVARQRDEGTRAMAAVPLPGNGAPLGGLILFFDTDQAFTDDQRRVYDSAARRISDAVRRVTAAAGGRHGSPRPDVRGVGLQAEGHVARCSLDHDPQSAGEARRFLRGRLAEWAVDDDISDNAQLCLSELVNNVIMHARASAELTVGLDGGVLTVVLRDHGGGPPVEADAPVHRPVPDDDPLRVFGRGLTLVDALADRWGTERDAVGTTAWFTLDVVAPRTSAG
ncbi:ATP-binding protein [Nocardioides sp. GCM10027113]|uniref:ATP-binding protein n=1 Tax=unclassified Nocardioides TaxID=2615069 RepID=UPI003616B3AE